MKLRCRSARACRELPRMRSGAYSYGLPIRKCPVASCARNALTPLSLPLLRHDEARKVWLDKVLPLFHDVEVGVRANPGERMPHITRTRDPKTHDVVHAFAAKRCRWFLNVGAVCQCHRENRRR